MRVHHHCMNVHGADCDAIPRIAVRSCPSQTPIRMPLSDLQRAKDFVPVSVFGTGPFILGINSSIPAKTIAEFVAYAKTRKINYGSSGVGSVAHLAGALGKPVWVLNRYDQCWRWLRHRTDSPWYPTARLFRQRSPGDWSGVIREVADALRA